MAKHARDGGPAGAVDDPFVTRDRSPGQVAGGPRHATPAPRRAGRVLWVAVGIVLLGGATGYLVVDRDPVAAPVAGAAVPASPTAVELAGTPPVASASPAEAPAPADATASGEVSAPATTSAPPANRADGPPGIVPSSGPGVSVPGILLVAAPAPDGSFDVEERVRLDRPTTVLTLRPAPVDRAGREFAARAGTASQIRITVDGRSVAVPAAGVDRSTTVPIADADRFDLRYRLADATVISVPSSTGRALAAIGPLTVGLGEDLPVRVVVTGSTVLGLNCPLLPFAEQSCGTRTPAGPGFEHELPVSLALTTVQFDLPSG